MISDIEDKIVENNEAEKKSKILDHECKLRELRDSIKSNNTRIKGVPKESEGEKGRRFI